MLKLSIFHPVSLAYKQFLPSVTATGVAGSEETLINYCKYLTDFNIIPHVYTQYDGTTIEWEHGYWKSKDLFFKEDHDCILSWSDNNEILKELRTYATFKTPIITRFVNQKNDTDFKIMYDLVDFILSQSEWLSSRYKSFNPSKFVFVTNGLKDKPNFNRAFGYNKIIYASDYERGLYNLLEFWPEINRLYPNYTLHICYGWEIFDKKYLNKGSNDYAHLFKNKIEELFRQNNVYHYGRLGHDQLYDLLHSCDFWLYPCNFPENCSTLSLKMQAYGVYPVIISSGGLVETVSFGSKTSKVLWTSNEQPELEEYNIALSEWQGNVLNNLALSPTTGERKHMMRSTYEKYDYSKCVSILAKLIETCVG